MSSGITLTGGSRFSSTFKEDICNRCHTLYPTADTLKNVKKKKLMNSSGEVICYRKSFPMQNVAETPVLQRMYYMASHVGSFCTRASPTENLRLACYASESSNNEQQLRLLESYFAKLLDDASQSSSDPSNKKSELRHKSGKINAKNSLESLDSYLEKLNKGPNLENYVSSTSDNETTESNQVTTLCSIKKSSERGKKGELKGYKVLRRRDGGSRAVRPPQVLEQNSETSYLYLIGTLASINIAVFLFEIASPISNSEFELFSVPLLYGAKINDLILVGEWWRLVTPMFLHSGIFHVALSCWALLTIGPQVCKSYGSFTFFLMYTLGGISGNLTSFLHTPEPTVGGTGPVFAIIGAWLIYQIQNKDVVAKDVSESMFQKALITTALSCIISNLGPIDNWTHFGAAFTGIIYGFLTCPMLQLGDLSPRTSQEERLTLVREYANPCKSLVVFTIVIIVLSSLLFVIEPPLDTLAP